MSRTAVTFGLYYLYDPAHFGSNIIQKIATVTLITSVLPSGKYLDKINPLKGLKAKGDLSESTWVGFGPGEGYIWKRPLDSLASSAIGYLVYAGISAAMAGAVPTMAGLIAGFGPFFAIKLAVDIVCDQTGITKALYHRSQAKQKYSGLGEAATGAAMAF